MDKATFDRILKEEGIEEAEFREHLWNVRPYDQDEEELRLSVRLAIDEGAYARAKERLRIRDKKIIKH